MRFVSKTEEEINAMSLWPVDIYSFEILEKISWGQNTHSTCDTMSKSGNDMIQLVVRVYNNEGSSIVLRDYLLESTIRKLRHACSACGLMDEYNKGELHAHHFVGRTGQLKLGIKKDSTGQYPDQNTISDYIPQEAAEIVNAVRKPVSAEPIDPELDDDVPF